jgi:hypothetical protein
MKNKYLVERDYAYEEKQRFIREVSARTPHEESLGEKIVGGVAFVAFIILICFI